MLGVKMASQQILNSKYLIIGDSIVKQFGSTTPTMGIQTITAPRCHAYTPENLKWQRRLWKPTLEALRGKSKGDHLVVAIHLGTNSIGQNLNTCPVGVASDVHDLMSDVQFNCAADVKFVISGILPRHVPCKKTTHNEHIFRKVESLNRLIEQANQEVRLLCKKVGHSVVFLDNKWFQHSRNLYSYDGLHLNREGSIRLAKVVKKGLQSFSIWLRETRMPPEKEVPLPPSVKPDDWPTIQESLSINIQATRYVHATSNALPCKSQRTAETLPIENQRISQISPPFPLKGSGKKTPLTHCKEVQTSLPSFPCAREIEVQTSPCTYTSVSKSPLFQKTRYVLGSKDPLSNFYPCVLKYKSKIFQSLEHIYQWEKALFFKENKLARVIFYAANAKEAKHLSKELPQYYFPWNCYKESLMWKLLHVKWNQCAIFRESLHFVQIFNQKLTHPTPDYFWGNRGKDIFAILLQKLSYDKCRPSIYVEPVSPKRNNEWVRVPMKGRRKESKTYKDGFQLGDQVITLKSTGFTYSNVNTHGFKGTCNISKTFKQTKIKSKATRSSFKQIIPLCKKTKETCLTNAKTFQVYVGGGGAEMNEREPETSIVPTIERVQQSLYLRVQALNMHIPNTQPGKCKILKLKNVLCSGERLIENPSDLPVMPSLNQLKELNTLILQERQTGQQNTYIVLDVGIINQCYISNAMKLYDLKEVQRQVCEEILWKDQVCTSVVQPQCKEKIDHSLILKCFGAIQNNKPHCVLKVKNQSIHVSSLCSLFSKRWLESDVHLFMSCLLNKFSFRKNVFVMDGTMFVNSTSERILDKCTKNMSNVHEGYIVLHLHVGINTGGFTFISDIHGPTGNHYTCAVYDIQNNRLVYCDSNGWKVPSRLHIKCNMLAKTMGLLSLPSLHVSHHPLSQEQVNIDKHVCDNLCSDIYPLQSCSSVCGVSVAITMVLAVLDRCAFQALAGVVGANKVFAKPYTFLRNISYFSDFLRCVLINWIMNETINLEQIQDTKHNLSDTQNAEVTAINNNSSERKKHIDKSMSHYLITNQHETLHTTSNCQKENIVLNPEENNFQNSTFTTSDQISSETVLNGSANKSHMTKSTCKLNQTKTKDTNLDIDFTAIEFRCIGKPSVFYKASRNAYVLRCTKKVDGKTTDKQFKCSSDGKNDSQVFQLIKQYILSPECVSWLEKKNVPKMANVSVETISNIASYIIRCNKHKNQLILQCKLLNGCTKRFTFNFSEAEIRNGSGKQQVLDFLHSPDFQQELKLKQNINEWLLIDKIPTGHEALQYVQHVWPFDLRKKYFINKHCESVFHSDTLLSSINTDNKWGKTHRFDENYSMKNSDDETEDSSENVMVVLRLFCASKSSECKNDCGVLLEDIDDKHKCNKCGTQNLSTCQNCKNTSSKYWYENSFGLICSTCSKLIPCKLSHKNYNHHMQCKWRVKMVIYKNDLKTWNIYYHMNNDKYHTSEPDQDNRRLTQTEKDRIDSARLLSKATPQQIHVGITGSPIIVDDLIKTRDISLSQIQNRIKMVDKHILYDNIKSKSTQSDWRNVELVLQGNIESVLFYQRGDKRVSRKYHIVLASEENIDHIQKYGHYICGYDIKHDLNAARFCTGILTYKDESNRGRIGAVTICNSEDTDSHIIHLQIIFANMKCSDQFCSHPQHLYVFSDKSGFFKIRPCALNIGVKLPLAIQHDKAESILKAVQHIQKQSKLCNYHGIRCIRSQCDKYSLQHLHKCLDIGFKVVMRSFHKLIRHNLIDAFLHFINYDIPDILLMVEDRKMLVDYFQDHWFQCKWVEAFTSEIIYDFPSPKNPLFQTNNITERAFKMWDESVNRNMLNKSITTQVIDIVTKILVKENTDTNLSKTGRNKKKVVNNATMETLKIEKALNITDDDIIMHEQCLDLGWIFVKATKYVANAEFKDVSFSISELENNELTENDFDTLYDNRNLDESILDITNAETENFDVNAKKITFLLSQAACCIWKKEILKHVANVKDYDVEKYHICNLYLGTCTCMYFIQHGQPYFCKHLYKANAFYYSINTAKELIQLYTEWKPTIPAGLKCKFPSMILKDNMAWDKLENMMSMSTLNTSENASHSLLSDLSEKHNNGDSYPGRKAERKPHNMGYRRRDGPLGEIQTIREKQFMHIDPYRPKIDFSCNSRERHGGRKLKRISKRGVTADEVQKEGLVMLADGLKQLHNIENNTKVQKRNVEHVKKKDNMKKVKISDPTNLPSMFISPNHIQYALPSVVPPNLVQNESSNIITPYQLPNSSNSVRIITSPFVPVYNYYPVCLQDTGNLPTPLVNNHILSDSTNDNKNTQDILFPQVYGVNMQNLNVGQTFGQQPSLPISIPTTNMSIQNSKDVTLKKPEQPVFPPR